MHRLLHFLLILALVPTGLLAAPAPVATQATPAARATADEAVAMVRKAIAAMKANGKAATIAEINDMKSTRFRDRDLYVLVSDFYGKNLAHGTNPKIQGKDLIDLKDGDGKAFVRERLELAKKNNSGWTEYTFVNPVSGNLEPKRVYFEKYEDVLVSCGVYK